MREDRSMWEDRSYDKGAERRTMKRLRKRRLLLLGLVLAGAAAIAMGGASGTARAVPNIHIVVIYEENHSYDNLYGFWENTRNLFDISRSNTQQLNQAGAPYTCLKQNDVNLQNTSQTCSDSTTGSTFTSHFPNQPFLIDDYLA